MEWLYKAFGFINKGPTFNLKLGNIHLMPSYLNAFIVVALLFVLVITMAQVRRHFMTWSFKGAMFGIFLGFLLALVLEGFLIIGGKTALTEMLGWSNPPKPVSTALDLGKDKLIQVLGEDIEIPTSQASMDDASSVLNKFYKLSSTDREKIKSEVCR